MGATLDRRERIDKGRRLTQAFSMIDELKRLYETLTGVQNLTPAQQEMATQVLTQVDRYFRSALVSSASEKRGPALSEPLAAAMTAAILMLEGIDTGSTGLDDQLAKSLRETYEKYLGPFRV